MMNLPASKLPPAATPSESPVSPLLSVSCQSHDIYTMRLVNAKEG